MLAAASAAANPLLPDQEIADPSVIVGGGEFHVISTSRTGPPAIPIRSSPDLVNWRTSGYVFRRLPRWIDRRHDIWAPEIYYFATLRKYIVYYSAVYRRRGTPTRCIGRAISDRLDDFTDRGFGRHLRPICNTRFAYSLIDPALFSVSNRSRYLLYKRDRTDRPKEIIWRSVDANDGASPLGTPRVLLRSGGGWESEGDGVDGRASVEAPTMVVNPGDTRHFYLFYSGNAYERDRYGVGVARFPTRGAAPRGPANPILTAERDPDYCGAGHQDVVRAGARWLLFYHAFPGPDEDPLAPRLGELCEPLPSGRRLMVDELRWGPDGWPTVGDGTPGP